MFKKHIQIQLNSSSNLTEFNSNSLTLQKSNSKFKFNPTVVKCGQDMDLALGVAISFMRYKICLYFFGLSKQKGPDPLDIPWIRR